MDRIKLIQLLLVTTAILLSVYLFVSMIGISGTYQNTEPAQSTPSQTPGPSSLTEYQACLDRAKDSRAPQEFIDEDIRECERLYRP